VRPVLLRVVGERVHHFCIIHCKKEGKRKKGRKSDVNFKGKCMPNELEQSSGGKKGGAENSLLCRGERTGKGQAQKGGGHEGKKGSRSLLFVFGDNPNLAWIYVPAAWTERRGPEKVGKGTDARR